jgi:hypothetical protein
LFGGAKTSETGLVGLNDVWALNINAQKGTGSWKCLINTDFDENGVGRNCPPGRNGATLTRVNALSLFPEALLKPSNNNNVHRYFLLQGGWNPFRTTYNDAFVLCVSSE